MAKKHPLSLHIVPSISDIVEATEKAESAKQAIGLENPAVRDLARAVETLAGGYDAAIRAYKGLEEETKSLRSAYETLEEKYAAAQIELERLRQENTQDSMTGLLTKERFYELLSAELGRAERTRKPLSVVMMDIDHFKRFNDKYGHLMGDEALKCVAGIIKDNSRDYDLVARFGGEEFVVASPNTDEEESMNLVDRIVGIIRNTNIPIIKSEGQTGEYARTTISAGIFTYHLPEDLLAERLSAETLVERADSALYGRKNNGRDGVTQYCAE